MCLFDVLFVRSNQVGLDQAGGLGHYVIETRNIRIVRTCVCGPEGLCLLMVRPGS